MMVMLKNLNYFTMIKIVDVKYQGKYIHDDVNWNNGL